MVLHLIAFDGSRTACESNDSLQHFGAAAGMTLELVDSDTASVANTLHENTGEELASYKNVTGDSGFKAAREAMKKKRPAATDDTDRTEAQALVVGQRVKSKASGKTGTVRFIGKIEPLPKGFWAGVELDDASGKNDGEVKGIRLFTCEPNKGAVMRPSTLEAVDGGTIFEAK
jgi:hypothetical protein